jgi:hypothetical protein
VLLCFFAYSKSVTDNYFTSILAGRWREQCFCGPHRLEPFAGHVDWADGGLRFFGHVRSL